ncbi:MAG: OmpA family protein [Nitrospirae bacterium]|nr:OmpA family protein [Nitrospirota bacterium]
MRRTFFITGIGLVILMTGCVSSSVHQAALKDLTETKSDLERLKGENAALKSERAAQDALLRDLRQQLADIQNKAQIQSQDSDRLAQRNIELSGEIADLTRQNRDFSQTLESRTQELEELRARLSEETRLKDEEVNRLKFTYDRLVGELQNEIKKGEITVTRVMDKLSVNLVEKILFDSGSAEIKPEGLNVLDRVGGILKSVTDKQIRIEGYTDNVPIGSRLTGTFPTNWELSAARAINVVRYLSGSVSIPSRLLSAAGLADNRPITSNDTKEGRAQNRRIEIVLLPMDMDRVLQELKPSPPSP